MPQEAWSDKRERQYEHIKESYEERGKSEEKAEELAARTVNKTRAEKGETKQQRDDD
jgi:plasmid stabilization system protein ParE